MNNPKTIVALIPARSGSKRVPGKNIRTLGGHPLLAYSIAAAVDSGIFERVIVSTDSERYAAIACHYGAEVPFLRPPEISGDVSPDIEWVEYTLQRLWESGHPYDAFSILRPTSPFRLPATIRRAWQEFREQEGVDSLRAVEKCQQHPGKMWVLQGKRMTPLFPFSLNNQPWHSNQYQALPEVYVQNASLEIAWTRVVTETRTISGYVVIPFLTKQYEGFDVNRPMDWKEADSIISQDKTALPVIAQPPYRLEE